MQSYTQMCSICCEEKIRDYEGIDRLRPEYICYGCWHNHILSIVGRMSYMVGDDVMSPFNNAPPHQIIDCLNSLTYDHAMEVESKLFIKYSSFTQDIEKCPSQGCDFVYVGEKCLWNSKENIYTCPKCQMPLTAIQPYSLKSVLASIYLILANKCPKCEIPIEKIAGCPHMSCPCGHQFCWFCYKDQIYGNRERLYTFHTIAECSFITISKIILILVCLCGLMFSANGNQTIKFIQEVFFYSLSIFLRSLVLDIWLIFQGFLIFMKTRRGNNFRGRGMFRFYITLALINLILIPSFLHLIGELYTVIVILGVELGLLGLIFSLGFMVAYSIDTWFEYVG